LSAAGDGQVPASNTVSSSRDTGHDGNRAVPQGTSCVRPTVEPDGTTIASTPLNQWPNLHHVDRNAHPLRIGLCGGTVANLQIAIPLPDGQLHSSAYDRRKIFEQQIEPSAGRRPMTPSRNASGAAANQAPLQGRLVGRPVLKNV